MESSSEVKWLGIKPYLFRIFSGFLVLWSINQAVYLVIAWATPIATQVPEELILVFPDQEPRYLTSLAFHSLAIVVFGVGAVTPSRTLMRVEEWWEVHRERPSWIAGVFLYVIFALVILGAFWVSITLPKYQVFIDPAAGSVIKRHTHLLRPGVVEESVNFANIREITLDLNYSSGGQGFYLSLATTDDQQIEVGRLTGDYTTRHLVKTGEDLSTYSRAPFNVDEALLPFLTEGTP